MRKKCPNCKQTKEDTDFLPSARSLDGLTTWCKNCKIIVEGDKKYKGLPIYKANDHWEIYAKVKRHVDINGIEYEEPCSDYIFRLKIDDLNWLEVKASRYYQRA